MDRESAAANDAGAPAPAIERIVAAVGRFANGFVALRQTRRSRAAGCLAESGGAVATGSSATIAERAPRVFETERAAFTRVGARSFAEREKSFGGDRSPITFAGAGTSV